MTLTETIEDAVIEALEQGARLPPEFSVRLPWDVQCSASPLVLIAGHVIHISPEELPAYVRVVH